MATLVSYTSAQCQGGASKFLIIKKFIKINFFNKNYIFLSTVNPNCAGGINLGRSGPSCRSANVWAWDGRTGQCRRILYRGCGGNRNRWCSQQQCLVRCRR